MSTDTTKTVASRLDAVTVFARGALCVRSAKLQAPHQRVRLAGLPLSAEASSFRGKVVQGPPGLVVRRTLPGFEVELGAPADVAAEVLVLEAAQEHVSRLERELAATDRELQLLVGLRPAFPPRPKEGPSRPAAVDALLALQGFVGEELAALQSKRREQARALEDARSELELRRRRLEEASTSARTERARITRAVVFELDGEAAGEVQLAVEYFVPGARWAPGYELRLERGMGRGSLAMRAFVAQSSGEDWEGVQLALSTADLDRRTDAPELKALKIGRAQPPPPSTGWRDPPPGLAELFTDYDASLRRRRARAMPPPPPPMAAPVSASYGAASMAEESIEPAPMMAEAVMAGPPGFAPSAPPASRRAAQARPAPSPKGSSGGGADMRERKKSAMKALAREEMADRAAADEGGYGGDDAPSAPAGLQPEEALLDYEGLSLPGADESGRGKLRPGEPLWRQLTTTVSVDVHVEVVARAVEQVRSRAERVASLSLPTYAASVREAAGSFDFRYDVEGRADVLGDGAWHTVSVCKADVEAQAEYVAVPSVEMRVYRTVKLTNRSRFALLQGPMDVVVGPEFLMTVQLPTLAPGAVERCGLGVEEAVQVARNTRYQESAGGLLGGATVAEHALEVELHNRLPHSAPIEVRERVPVSGEADVKVEEVGVTPAWARPMAGDGVTAQGARLWRLTLGAREKVTLKATYALKFPAGKMLVGGNRRS